MISNMAGQPDVDAIMEDRPTIPFLLTTERMKLRQAATEAAKTAEAEAAKTAKTAAAKTAEAKAAKTAEIAANLSTPTAPLPQPGSAPQPDSTLQPGSDVSTSSSQQLAARRPPSDVVDCPTLEEYNKLKSNTENWIKTGDYDYDSGEQKRAKGCSIPCGGMNDKGSQCGLNTTDGIFCHNHQYQSQFIPDEDYNMFCQVANGKANPIFIKRYPTHYKEDLKDLSKHIFNFLQRAIDEIRNKMTVEADHAKIVRTAYYRHKMEQQKKKTTCINLNTLIPSDERQAVLDMMNKTHISPTPPKREPFKVFSTNIPIKSIYKKTK